MMGRVDDVLLQQLVDGELDEPMYCEVLTALSEDSEGWRRCALAFLEDQALRREFSMPQREESPVSRPAVSRPQVTALLLAIAASFLLAFAAGYELQRWRHWKFNNGVADGAAKAAANRLANSTIVPRVGEQMDASVDTSSSPLGSVQLVVDGADGAAHQAIDVPVYPLDSSTLSLLVDSRSSLPPNVYEALQKLGSRVQRSQYWAPVDLQDGRQLVIPVEQLEITPVSRPY